MDYTAKTAKFNHQELIKILPAYHFENMDLIGFSRVNNNFLPVLLIYRVFRIH